MLFGLVPFCIHRPVPVPLARNSAAVRPVEQILSANRLNVDIKVVINVLNLSR